MSVSNRSSVSVSMGSFVSVSVPIWISVSVSRTLRLCVCSLHHPIEGIETEGLEFLCLSLVIFAPRATMLVPPRHGAGNARSQAMKISKAMWSALCVSAEWHTDQQMRQGRHVCEGWLFVMELEKYLNGHVCAWPRYRNV